MARRADPSIRNALREKAIDYVFSHGVVDLSLRPLAAALGTNARMLVYHFVSREGLMRAILAGLRERESVRIEAWIRSGKRPRNLPEFLRWYWKRFSSTRTRPAALLIFELYALALRSPAQYPGVLEDPVDYWNQLVGKVGIPGANVDSTSATLLLAATRGLLLDLTATGDRARVKRALDRLIELLEGEK